MFFGLFGNDCNCSDRIIDYLDSEKYEWIDRKFTPKQRKEAEKYVSEAYKLIDDSPFYRSTQKEVMRFKIRRSIFQEQREKPRLVKITK